MKKSFIFFIAITSLMFWSCEKQLDLTPKNSIGDGKVFEKVADLELGKIGVYGSFSSMESMYLSSRASDDLRLIAENTGQGVSIHNWTYTAGDGDIEGLWDRSYKSIDRANRLLVAAESFVEGASTADLAIINDVIGHCLFIRAFQHFELVRGFSPVYAADAIGVPYMLEYTVTGSPARLTSLEVYNNIKSDLTRSIANITSTSRNMATVHAANALMARVLLWQGDYDNAIVYAKKVIDESGLTLAARTEVSALWKDELADSKEIIFRLDKNTGEGELGSIFQRSTNADIYFQPSVDLISQYGAQDIRLSVYFANLATKPIVTKYIGKTGGSKNIVNVKLLRLSEMYLIIAEAYANKGELVNAANYVFEIQSRRDLGAVAAPVYTTKVQAIDGVLLEKRKEMTYEGHRFFDLKRYNKGIVRTGLDEILATGDILPAGDYRFVLPIPQAEMFANENMVQNANY